MDPKHGRCIFYKLSTLTELKDLQALMSTEQNADFRIPAGILTAAIVLCIFGTLAVSAVLLLMQVSTLQSMLGPGAGRPSHRLLTDWPSRS